MLKLRTETSRRGQTRAAERLEARELLAAQSVLIPSLVGDLNGDDVVDNFDIAPFALAVSNAQEFRNQYPAVHNYAERGDVSGDGVFDTGDVQPFIEILINPVLRSTSSAVSSTNGTIAPLATAAVSVQPGVWISADQVRSLPMSGTAWTRLVADAKRSTGTPDVSNQSEDADVLTLAKAIVGVRTNNATYLAQVRANVMAAIGTEVDGRTLALGRNLASYVISANLVGLSATDDVRFRAWLGTTLSENLDGDTLRSTHELRANNWGTMAGASRAAVAVYLGDTVELARTAQVFKGWLGDRTSYAGFKYGDTVWQANPKAPVGINPLGATKDGHSIDGALPEEMRRGGTFAWPPKYTNYPWGALQGVVVQAEILYRAGYDAWQWNDRAILRSVQYLYSLGWAPTSDDQWIVSLINARYGTTFTANMKASPGKIMGWTAWTHQKTTAALSATSAAIELPAVAVSVTADESIDQVALAVATEAPPSTEPSDGAVSRELAVDASMSATSTSTTRSRSPKLSQDAEPEALDRAFSEPDLLIPTTFVASWRRAG